MKRPSLEQAIRERDKARAEARRWRNMADNYAPSQLRMIDQINDANAMVDTLRRELDGIAKANSSADVDLAARVRELNEERSARHVAEAEVERLKPLAAQAFESVKEIAVLRAQVVSLIQAVADVAAMGRSTCFERRR
jgi:hypothetical protein